jgi:hypothetical protein
MNSLDKLIAEIKAAADELKADNDKAEQKENARFTILPAVPATRARAIRTTKTNGEKR